MLLSIYMLPPGANDGELIIEKDTEMSGPYKLTLKYDVKEGGEDFQTGQNTYHRLGTADLAGLFSMAKEAEDLAVRRQNEGGQLQVVLSAEVTGGTVPPGIDLSPKTYKGLTRHGWTTVENNLADIGKELVKRGRFKAIKKEGKPTKKEDDTPAADW